MEIQMKTSSRNITINILKGLEVFGSLLMGRKQPPWIQDKEVMDKKTRRSWQYNIWRSAVLRRDGYECVLCGDDRKSQLQVDHIKPFSLFPELRFAIDNGRTLCIDCHKKTETYGGKVKQWKR